MLIFIRDSGYIFVYDNKFIFFSLIKTARQNPFPHKLRIRKYPNSKIEYLRYLNCTVVHCTYINKKSTSKEMYLQTELCRQLQQKKIEKKIAYLKQKEK